MESTSTPISVQETANLFGEIFEFDEEGGKSRCLLIKNGNICGKYITGKKPYNLKRHVNLCHRDYNKNIIENEYQTIVSPESLLNACVEIITINGRPFSMLGDSGFRKILKMLFSLNEKRTGTQLQITTPQVKEHMHSISDDIKKKIMEETNKKLISLQLDICTKNNRAILGINIQYVKNSKIVLRTLKMVTLTERHTGKNLAIIVKDALAEFGISLLQLYSVTTDNGPNVVLSAEIMNDLAEAIADEIEKELTLDQIEEDFFEELLKETEREFFDADFIPEFVISLSCGAHTFQLAIKYALIDSTETNALIEKCRTVMKTLRTPTILRAMKEKHLNFPLLDNITRWNGKFSMVRKAEIVDILFHVIDNIIRMDSDRTTFGASRIC